jgi:HEAT repeat protein
MAKRILLLSMLVLAAAQSRATYLQEGFRTTPKAYQLQRATQQLNSTSPVERAAAAEQLGLMRAYEASALLVPLLNDPDPAVRREAVMALGWLGNRNAVAPLMQALNDSDWTVRQASAVALENLTAVPFAYDACAGPEPQRAQVDAWQAAYRARDIGKSALDALGDAECDFFTKADRIRAAGTFRCASIVTPLTKALRPYLTKRYPPDNLKRLYTPASPSIDARPERAFVQAGIRMLGRIGGEEAEGFLIEMLENNQDWACYAAEALGDCGGPKAVSALIRQYPDYAFRLDHPMHSRTYKEVVPKVPDHDRPRLSPIDRIPRTAYEILLALSRLDLSRNTGELRSITPYILSTLPNMWDATVVYTEEPWAMISGYLLEQAGVRQQAVNAALTALGIEGRELSDHFELKAEFMAQASKNLQNLKSKDAPYAGSILLSTAQEEDIPALIDLLNHPSGWIKIDAAKTLMMLDAQDAAPVLVNMLETARDDADYGYGMEFRRFSQAYIKGKKLPGSGYDEYSDPSPRFKEAFLRTLGRLESDAAVPLLTEYLNNDRNALEIQVAAGLALDEIGTPAALEALRSAEVGHPVAVVQINAREALWRHRLALEQREVEEKIRPVNPLPLPDGLPQELVFIKGDREPGNNEQFSKDMTAYSTTDGGPTYRYGRNIFRLKTADPEASLQQLTYFESGYVSDLEVSYDGSRVLFSRNTLDPEPWLHIYEMNADGSGLKQLTFGPYHDVHPNYMPDGRIVFTTSRSGIRDEYHGYPANGLAVMNADGSDIHVIGFNIGRDAEPVISDDGKILFTRLELFYSRMKTEWNLLSVFPDGTRPNTLYGPERRDLHRKIPGADAISPPRHRALRLTQPQSWSGTEYLLNTFKGPMLAGPGRIRETFLNPESRWAITTPYKVDASTLLVAAGERPLRTEDHPKKKQLKAGMIDFFESVDHGLYWMDVKTGQLTLVYNDPDHADFEARPLQPRKVPPILSAGLYTRSRAFSGTLYCSSAFVTQDPFVKERGKYIRVIEGIPTIARHQTHTDGGIAWRNHGGAVGRVLGTVPLAADGSFSLELPADHLYHLQVLDADRRVMGNELIWQYVRPKEIKGCVGCHENPETTPSPSAFPLAQRMPPVKCLPHGNEMQYRAKMWFKGWAPDEREERMRTVNSINVIGRN